MMTEGPRDKIVIATTSCIATPKSPSSFEPVTSIRRPGAPVPVVCASKQSMRKAEENKPQQDQRKKSYSLQYYQYFFQLVSSPKSEVKSLLAGDRLSNLAK